MLICCCSECWLRESPQCASSYPLHWVSFPIYSFTLLLLIQKCNNLSKSKSPSTEQHCWHSSSLITFPSYLPLLHPLKELPKEQNCLDPSKCHPVFVRHTAEGRKRAGLWLIWSRRTVFLHPNVSFFGYILIMEAMPHSTNYQSKNTLSAFTLLQYFIFSVHFWLHRKIIISGLLRGVT